MYIFVYTNNSGTKLSEVFEESEAFNSIYNRVIAENKNQVCDIFICRIEEGIYFYNVEFTKTVCDLESFELAVKDIFGDFIGPITEVTNFAVDSAIIDMHDHISQDYESVAARIYFCVTTVVEYIFAETGKEATKEQIKKITKEFTYLLDTSDVVLVEE